MGHLPVIPDTYRVAFRWTSGTVGNAVTVAHFQAPTLSATGVKSALDSNVTAAMWQPLKNTTKVTQLDILKLDGFASTISFGVTGSKWAGVGTTNDELAAVAAIVKLVTGFRGPARRGRHFLPFVSENSANSGQVISSDLSVWQAAWTAFLPAMNTAGCAPVVASYVHGDTKPVTTYVCETYLGTQRDRQTRLRPK